MKNSNPVLIYILLSAIISGSFLSCTTYKNISYFKNLADSGVIYKNGENIPVSKFTPLRIEPDDILNVSVTTIDQNVNGAVNITDANSNIQGSIPAANIPGMARASDGYLVNKKGFIDLPVLGQVKVGGLTIDSARGKILQRAMVLYKNPTVNVRLTNFKVTVLGEVARPGTYVVDGERVSVLDALGLSGDLTIYAKRENVLLIRQNGDSAKTVVRFNLNDTHMMNSPYFYLRQGDVIYAEPGKGKAAATDMAATRNYAIAGSVLTVLVVLLSRINF